MLIQINGKQYADASKDIIVLQLNPEEKQGILQSKPTDDLFAYFPKATQKDAVDYHVKKMDDKIVNTNKSAAEQRMEELAGTVEAQQKELEELRAGIVKPVPMGENGELPTLEAEKVEAEIVVPEEVN